MSGLNKLQNIELDILDKFSQVCKQEDITWFAMFGTLLGAVRHSGFIPWDDDVDVAIPRADYERLRNCPELFSEPCFLQTTQNDPAAVPRFMRLRRSDTAILRDFPNGMTRGGNMGIYIDILPLDDAPNAKIARRMHITALRIQKQMFATAALDESIGDELPDYKAEWCYSFGGIAGCYPMLAERYEWICSKYSSEPFYTIPVLGSARGCRLFDKQWFAMSETMEFEGMKVPVPSGWREVLCTSYPEGLLEPEEEDRKTKPHAEETIVDTERSYKEYVSYYTDMLKDIKGKRVLIFGAGDSLRIWLERYSNGLEIVCAFDNSRAKWGTTAYGIPIRPPQELPTLLNENSRLIIASVWHREISRQLKDMHISDYYVFIDGINYRRR